MALKDTEKIAFANILAKAEAIPYKSLPKRIGLKVGAFIGIIVIAVTLGVVLTVLPLMALASSVVVAEPAIETWRELPEDLPEITIAERNTLYTADGTVFAEVWAENRVIIDSLDDVSDNVINALIATEDKDFREHGGYDPRGIARALVTGSGGGSSLSQQLIKNLQFYNIAGTTDKEEAVESSYLRKIKELKLTINYEKEHSKDDILLSYLNTVAMGKSNIYGVETASQYFFGVPATELSVAQAAALVGTVQNPVMLTMDDPENNDWVDRQHHVINRMLDEGYITEAEADEAVNEELVLVRSSDAKVCSESEFPFYCEYVLDELSNSPRLGDTQEARDAILAKGGLHIYTYLDAPHTRTTEAFLSNSFGNDNRIVSPTAVVEPGTGGIKVMAVNREYGEGEGKTMISVPANPTGTGSTYKLMTLATALENGFSEKDLNFASRCPLYDPNYDIPVGGVKNSGYCGRAAGKLNYLQATGWSSNTWYAELIIKVGVLKVKELSASMGLSAPEGITERSISYSIGSTENSPIDMAAAYATFANEGVFCPATSISNFTYDEGAPVPVPDEFDPSTNACRGVISPHTASVVLKAMRAVVDGSVPGSTGERDFIDTFDVVGKTGTNQLYNTAQVLVSKPYAMFMNVYDMDTLVDGIEYVWYNGRYWSWMDHPAGDASKLLMLKLLEGSTPQPLDFSATSRLIIQVPIEERDFYTTPSVIGMTPEAAVMVLESAGFEVLVDKDLVYTSTPSFPSGVIMSQSIEPDTQLPLGSVREIVLAVSK